MATSKKDYVATANVIRTQVDLINSNITSDEMENFYRNSLLTLKLVAFDLASYFKTSNSKFDRTRFMEACGFDETIRVSRY